MSKLWRHIDNAALDAWRERVAIVRFCSGREMTEHQAQRIVQMQMGMSDEEWEEMKKKDSGMKSRIVAASLFKFQPPEH